jgi:hypothetical protein
VGRHVQDSGSDIYVLASLEKNPMSVWLCIPSARPPAEASPVLQRWREQGYKIALYFDGSPSLPSWPPRTRWQDMCDTFNYPLDGKYPGYAVAVNTLVSTVMQIDPDADWFVTGGDDVLPDPDHTADEIAAQLTQHFGGTFGVMQPTGDRFAGGQIDRICGSPWMGREWCKRINQGLGPLWPDYTHMFVDEELQCVAQKYGVLWQRPDLIHLHRHFMRESDAIDSRAVGCKERPEFLDEANSREHWMTFEKLFKTRRAQGFSGSEPL